MSAVKAVDTTNAPVAPKVVPLHQYAHEEQTKSFTAGTTDSTGRARKSMLPASDLAKVPSGSGSGVSDAVEELLEQIQQNENLSESQKQEIETKLKQALSEIKKNAHHLLETLSASQTPTAAPSSGQTPSNSPSNFDAWNQSILMLYQAFAVNQMNQNNEVMNGWVAQQQAQNVTLQDAANGEQQLATESTTAKHADGWKCGLWGFVAAIGAAILTVAVIAAVTVFTAGAGDAIVLPLAAMGWSALAAAGVAGIGTGVGCYVGAEQHPGTSADITSAGPDQSQMEDIQNENTFWSMISQKANNLLSTGSQTDVVNASSNNTTLGQQASQVIQALGQVMQTPVAH